MLYHDSDSVTEALSRYYQLNGLPADGGLSDRWAKYKIGPLVLVGFPNFEHRRKMIVRHDLHHIVNNIDTTSIGEGHIAAWELGSGCDKSWISWCMEPQALWWGILLSPKKTWYYFKLGQLSENFFRVGVSESLWSKNVGELRQQLLPKSPDLQSRLKDYVHFSAQAILGIIMILIFIPIFTFFSLFSFVVETRAKK